MVNVVLGEFKPTLNERRAEQQKYLEQVASGRRISNAGVDAASLAIGSLINSQGAALSVAASNASTSQALLNVAGSGIESASGVLEQLKSLATLAQSGTLTPNDLSTLNNQFTSLKNELDTIAGTTSFFHIVQPLSLESRNCSLPRLAASCVLSMPACSVDVSEIVEPSITTMTCSTSLYSCLMSDMSKVRGATRSMSASLASALWGSIAASSPVKIDLSDPS